MPDNPHPRVPQRVRAVTLLLGAYVLAGGVVSFLGWALDVRRLTDWFGMGISIQPNACVAVAFSGLALLMLTLGATRAARVVAVVPVVIGATTLFQYLTGVNLAFLNEMLHFDRTWGATGVVTPGRMGPPGATSWTVVGFALLLASAPPGSRARRWVPGLGMAAGAIGMLSIAGYLYGAGTLYSMPYLTVIALQTATFILASALAVMASVPERPPMRWILDGGTTGVIARMAIPLFVIVPVLVGWLRLLGEEAGFYDTRFGVAIHALALIGLLMLLLAWSLSFMARHEKALRESEKLHADTLASITDGFLIMDREWRYEFVNDEGARLLGRAKVELIGRKAWELFPEAVGSKAHAELHRAAAEGVSVEFEAFNSAMDRWFMNRAYPTPGGGITVIFQDITERKVARQRIDADLAVISRLQSLATQLVPSGELNSLLGEILAASIDLAGTSKGYIQFHDEAAARLRVAVSQGLSDAFVRHVEEDGGAETCDKAARTGERVVVEDIGEDPAFAGTREHDALAGEGVRAVLCTPLHSRDGRLLGMLNILFERRHRAAERELRYLDLLARMAADVIERAGVERELRDADRRKDEFIATLAHELRGPLAPIANSLEVLDRSKDAAAKEAAREIMRRQLAQLVRLVDDLLDVSRISRDKLDLRRQAVDLASVVTQATESCAPLIQSMDQQLAVELPPEKVVLDADGARLVQVVSNLLNNASKYTPQRGRIRLEASVDGRTLVVSVRDSGVGLSSEDLASVFGIFSQVGASTARPQGGLGIGLYLVRRLVELHGGTVEAISAGRGLGSEFVVRMPIVESVSAVAPAPAAEQEATPQPWRFLLVDDNVDSVESLEMLLRVNGNETHVVHDGFAAVEAADRIRPDIILLDIGLPGMNGYETCRKIREKPWGDEMFIVALTGWGQPEDRRKSSEAGFDHHLVKPVDYPSLIALIEAAQA